MATTSAPARRYASGATNEDAPFAQCHQTARPALKPAAAVPLAAVFADTRHAHGRTPAEIPAPRRAPSPDRAAPFGAAQNGRQPRPRR